jgi:peptidoglycan/LPS O-acetylase OafA/YrhL
LVAAVGVLWIYREVMLLVVGVPERYAHQALDMRADHLLIGCLLAVALYEGSFARLWSFVCRSPLMQVATLILLVAEEVVASAGLHRFRLWGGYILEPVLFVLLIPQLIAFRNGPLTRVLETPLMRYLGRISYSVYLYQQAVILSLLSRLQGTPTGLLLLACVGGAILFGSASYFLVEQPFLTLKDRFRRDKMPAPARMGRETIRVLLENDDLKPWRGDNVVRDGTE